MTELARYTFRPAHPEEAECVWQMMLDAKAYMRRLGRNQWDEAYPTPELITGDIAAGEGYVLCTDGVPAVYGAVVFREEPAYREIDGRWLSDRPYVVLHRMAAAEAFRGQGLGARFFAAIERLAAERGIESFRVDTNFDNADMLHLFEKLGFTYCGKIHYPQGERLAYEKRLK